jgi:hypothetical protein
LNVFDYWFKGAVCGSGMNSCFYRDNFVFPIGHVGRRLEFAWVLAFVDIFRKSGLSVFDCGSIIGFADWACDDVVMVRGFNFESVTAFGAFCYHFIPTFSCILLHSIDCQRFF